MHDWLGKRRRRGPRPDASPPAPDERAALRLAEQGRFLRRVWRSSRERWRRVVIGGLLIWVAYALLLSPNGALYLARLQHRADRLAGDVQRFEATRDSLARVLAATERGDPFVLEGLARERFGFARDNERVYVLPENAADDRALAAAGLHGAETFAERAERSAVADSSGAP